MKRHLHCALLGSAAVVVMASASSPAWSQAADPAPQAPAAQTAGSNSDIVVTARRREESVQSVPVAVTAFSQRTLEQRSIYNAVDLSKAVPGLEVSTDNGAGSSIPSFSIRGRGQSFGAASGSVETYFADVPLSAPFEVPTLPPQFFDLQSVQVLKGPQGTLFGRNSTGGAVLFVPAAPTDELGGYIRLQGGTFDDFQFEGAVNLPISDKVMLRVAGFEWHRKGYSRTVGGETDAFGTVLPSQRFDNQDVTETRATLLLKPSDRFTNSTIFTYHTDTNRGSAQATLLKESLFTGNPGDNTAVPVTGAAASPRVLDTDVNLRRKPSSTWAVINTTTYDLTDNLTVKNIFGHIHAAGLASNPSDTDGTPFAAIDLEPSPRLLKNFQTTEELQFQGHAFDNRLDYIFGGLIDLTRQPGDRDSINPNTVTYPASSPTVPLGIDQQFRQSHFTSKSAFVSATVHLTDNLSLTAGGRYSQDYIRERTIEYVTPLPDRIADPSVPSATLSHTFKGWSYNASAEWKIDPGSMVYGGYRHGYKRGGFNARPPSPEQALFGPENVNDYYFGLKKDLRFLGMPGHFNIEGFWDVYKGAQRFYLSLVDQGGIVALATVTTNAEKSTYRGFDTDFAIDPAPWLTLIGNYTYVDAYYNRFIDRSLTDPAQLALLADPSTDLSVNPLGLVSRHKVSVTARLHKTLADGGEIAFQPTFSYQSKFYLDDFSVRQPNSSALLFLGGQQLNAGAEGADQVAGYKLVDLRVEWNKVLGSRFDLALNVNNLLNKTYGTGGTAVYEFGFQSLSFGPPRMATIDARVHF